MFVGGTVEGLYSTIFGATASNARLLADALDLFRLKRYRNEAHRVGSESPAFDLVNY